MGNEPSKQAVVEPPPEWDPASNAKKFELVSPMSDLSDPSMFLHRRPHPKMSSAAVQELAGKKQARAGKEPPKPEQRRSQRQTPAGDRRRKSKVITRDSAYKHESRPRDLAPPSAFYFPAVPTRETEENLNRMSVRKSSSTDGKDKPPQDKENKENYARKNTPLLKKAKRKVNRATSCLTFCFDESSQNIQLMKDNAKPSAKRGQKLPSEAGGETKSLVKIEENPIGEESAFDPYKEDPLPEAKPTVLQFIDGAEKELAFNPVWRESHDGTYHSDPSVDGSKRRASEFSLKRNSKDTARRASDPPSQSSKPYPASPIDKEEAKPSHVPHPPGDQLESPSSKEKRESVGSSNSNKESASEATSHESTYWNGFYNEAQVLHHEDSYFDRIAFAPNNKSSVPEPSPMANHSGANHSTATPVMDLFSQAILKSEQKSKCLLGTMDSGDVEFDEKLCPSRSYSEEDSLSKQSKRLSKASSKGFGSSYDERDDSSLSRRSRQETSGSKTSTSEAFSSKERDSHSTSRREEQPLYEDSGALVVMKSELEEDHPVDEQLQDQKENLQLTKPPRHSYLDRRVTADKILVQTSLVRSMARHPESKRESIDVRAALQETPKNALVEHRTSIGSAFSYKDKDVFTPVTSLATYPKGSPFRPRVVVTGKAMAKAKLDQPVMFTQSFDNRSRCSRDMEIQACDSAPSMIESHDYRDIALGCFLEDTPSTMANKRDRVLALVDPKRMSLESPMSAAMSPAQPLLSNQVINNAAFLFSPSYGSGMSLLSGLANTVKSSDQSSQQEKQIVVTPKDARSAFSISTLGSRSRLSGRSKKAIRIPFSSSSSVPLIKGGSIKSGSRKSAVSEDGSRQKSVRFSDGHSVSEQSQASSQKSRRSVTWDFSFKAPTKDVNIPAIETKVSDLSDTVFGRDPSPASVGGSTRERMESVKSAKFESTIKEEETASLTSSETLSRHSMASTKATQEESVPKSTGTPEQSTRTWTYNEFSRGVTPLLDKKQLAKSTNSPVLRFKAAKNKFVGTHIHEKEVPVKKSPSFNKRKAGTGRVHLLASKFDNGGPPIEPVTLKSSSRDYSELGRPLVTASAAQQGDKPMLRTPQIVGYAPKSYPNIYQRASVGSLSTSSSQYSKTAGLAVNTMPTRSMSTDDSEGASTYVDKIPEEEYSDSESQHSGDDDSTFVQSVATLRQDRPDRLGYSPHVVEQDQRLSDVLDEILNAESTDSSTRGSHSEEDMPCDEAADDFAEILLKNILEAPSQDDGSVGTDTQTLKQVRSTDSWQDEENSTFTDILAAPTFSDESTTMSAILAQQTTANLRHGAKTVKPHVQRLRYDQSVSSHALHLSPNMRTATQASKWRELAERAQKQDTSKKSIFRPGTGKKAKALSERNTNIVA